MFWRTVSAAGSRTRRLQVGDHAVDVHGTFAPQRPQVLLVHGLGMSGEYFQPLTDVLAATHDVYALDLPGYGKTPNPERALSISKLSEVVAGVVTTLELDSPVVVGHSMGCQIVADAVATHPEMFAGYVLIGPTVDPSARSFLAQSSRLMRDTLREPPRNNFIVFRNYVRMGPLRYLHTVRHMLADRTEESIQRCTIPGLVVRGENDPIASAEWARQLVDLAPDASLVEIPDAPHALQIHRPKELASACAPFLAAVDGERPGPQTTAPRA
ncbi:alpha/beta hydrolase [Nesterenkonia sp. AY15]|uniref:alpha/beta fold hydrolase n=1 Tax=unclassified Nesterenkonia TaxID=2629769 RepID=UPI001F4D30D5|nr:MULTISPECIES: alpha/beta hydrolase [unclassified Nesterenkonia]MCH8563625.1 alpha/beta hydrolase [Nesterenkonia sp. YGD6]MCH8570848.1 alpha/beta hydrolase [Nesterenkonia sp. AY15]